jgi:hypothetical protein
MADGPLLVHIQHDAGVWAKNLAGQQRAANIALRVGRPHLLKSMREMHVVRRGAAAGFRCGRGLARLPPTLSLTALKPRDMAVFAFSSSCSSEN